MIKFVMFYTLYISKTFTFVQLMMKDWILSIASIAIMEYITALMRQNKLVWWIQHVMGFMISAVTTKTCLDSAAGR